MSDIKIIGKIGQFTTTTSDNTDKGILFLYPEAKGFDIHELKSPTNNSLPTQKEIEPYFNTVAVIANTSDPNYKNHWHYCKEIYTNDFYDKWASFYFGNKNDFKNSPVKEIIKNIFGSDYDETANKFTEPTINIENIIGIALDDEWENGNDNNQFRQEVLNFFESFKKSKISSLRNIKIAWSQGLASINRSCPKQNKPCEPWDYFLAQVYTPDYPYDNYYTKSKNIDICTNFKKNDKNKYDFDDHLKPLKICNNLNSTQCEPLKNKICKNITSKQCDKIINCKNLTPEQCELIDSNTNSIYGNLYQSYKHQINNPNYPVTMLCGSGNCQETFKCIDQRKNTKDILHLISNRPTNFPWKNFAIWYGTGSQPNCGGCGDKYTNKKECENKIPKSGCIWYPSKSHKCNLDVTKPWGCEKKW